MKYREQSNMKKIPAGVMEVSLSAVSCHVAVSTTGRSLLQGRPTDCGVPLWSKNLKNEETSAGVGLLRQRKKNYALNWASPT